MRLTPGIPAPHFHVADVRGLVVDLSAWRGSIVWLGFFRFALCPLCNLRVHQMVGEWKRFEGRCHFIGVFQSPLERLKNFMSVHNPPFPVVADPKLALFKAYRVEEGILAMLHPAVMRDMVKAKKAGHPLGMGPSTPKDGAALRVPADFIIAPDGSLKTTRYGSHVGDSIPFDEAHAAIAELEGSRPTT